MDHKLDQLERLGATEIDLLCGPFKREFEARYAGRAACWADAQTGVRDAIGDHRGWWTMGDVLLGQPLDGEGVCFVTPGEQIGGLWLDCGLYHGPGPWRMVPTKAKPLTINTPEDRRGAHEELLKQQMG
jgi:hypothetical protein